MMPVAIDLTHLIERIFLGSGITKQGVLWGALAVVLLFTSILLVTMLVTRWGDSKITSKALIFSVLAHVSCSLGLIIVNPSPFLLEKKVKKEPDKPDPVQIRQVFVEGAEKVEIKKIGNTPVWEKHSEPTDMRLTRLDRLPLELKPVESPERRPEPVTLPEVSIPDLLSLPKEPVVTPQPEKRGEKDLLVEAAKPLKIDEPTAEARQDVEIPSSSRARRSMVRTGQTDTAITRETRPGAIDRVQEMFDPSQNLALLDTVVDPSSFLKRGPEEMIIRRRAGPAPSAFPKPEAGTTAEKPTEDTGGGSPGRTRISRRLTKTFQSVDDGSTERFRSRLTPKIPIPIPGPSVAVHGGSLIDIPRNGPHPPNVKRPNYDGIRSQKPTIPLLYSQRNRARRKESASKFGGTDASERAVESSLRWLARHQSPEGYWDADAYGSGQVKKDENGNNRRNAGKNADTGLTALAVLAFLGANYTPEEGPYADEVDRALDWLVNQQRYDGYLGGDASHYAKMYCHGMATYALAEAYGMQSDPTSDTRLRRPLERAVNYILGVQNHQDGGWRYKPYFNHQKSDMSVFGWQLMALKSAENSGIKIPEFTKGKMVDFLKKSSRGKNKGLAGYRVGFDESPSMTAEALFCKQMLGLTRINAASTEAVEYLMQHLPKRSETNLYYWYYGTLAMFQYGGKPWREWNESLRDQLVAAQRQTGDNAGSWDANGRWGRYGGRVYSTALSTLCLEVYYRYLPLYQIGERHSGQSLNSRR